MILCHSLKIIFLKTKKVGGTSFEIALSKYCDDNDIVTPISPDDEITREALGYQKPVNYLPELRINSSLNVDYKKKNSGIVGKFRKHMSSEEVFCNIGEHLFRSYKKISIHRDPLDFLISQYFFKNRNKSRHEAIPFERWLEQNYSNVTENFEIAPTSGPYSMDIIFRYEALIGDIESTGILPSDFIPIFKSLSAKGTYRDPKSRNAVQFFEESGCGHFIPKIKDLLGNQVS